MKDWLSLLFVCLLIPSGFAQHSVEQEHHPNGQLAKETSYQDNTKEGWERHWYPSGQLKSEGEYKQGLQEGAWFHYFESGALRIKRFLKEDFF